MLRISMIGLALVAGSAAAQTTFFGEDINPNPGASGIVTTLTNTRAAQSSFNNALAGNSTESFESFGVGATPPLGLSFTGSAGTITADLSGTGSVQSTAGNAFGRAATDGNNYFETIATSSAATSFTITFGSPVAAFGFVGTDLGDFGSTVSLDLTNGGTTNVPIPTAAGTPNGSALFFGVIAAPGQDFLSITFNISASTGAADVFGFDEMTVGDRSQVVIPLPTGAGLAGLGLLAVGARRRR